MSPGSIPSESLSRARLSARGVRLSERRPVAWATISEVGTCEDPLASRTSEGVIRAHCLPRAWTTTSCNPTTSATGRFSSVRCVCRARPPPNIHGFQQPSKREACPDARRLSNMCKGDTVYQRLGAECRRFHWSGCRLTVRGPPTAMLDTRARFCLTSGVEAATPEAGGNESRN